MAKAKEKESLTLVAPVESTPVVKGSKRNPDYEKAMTEVAKYVNGSFEDNDGVEFCVDHRAKVVVCRRIGTIHSDDPAIDGAKAPMYGISKCCPSDRFNPLLGKYIALKRARNRPIPDSIRKVVFGN